VLADGILRQFVVVTSSDPTILTATRNLRVPLIQVQNLGDTTVYDLVAI
jgi:hypothetical protein